MTDFKKFSSAFVLFFTFFLLLANKSHVFSDELLNIANTYTSKDTDLQNGDLVSRTDFSQKEIVKSDKAYDIKLLGVVFDKPTVVYRVDGMDVSVVEHGEVLAKVTSLNGSITAGDALTSSEIAGKGQKANLTSSIILGTALENLSESNSTEITYNDKKIREGEIRVMVNIGSGISPDTGVISKLTDQLSLLILRNTQTPQGAQIFFRYLAAAFLAAIIIFVSFTSFGRNIAKGIEAIGRNPLVKTQIQAMIVFNIILIAVICVAGVILSLAIIRF